MGEVSESGCTNDKVSLSRGTYLLGKVLEVVAEELMLHRAHKEKLDHR